MFRRTLNTLRERPKHERTAIAAWSAIGVVAVLLICWLIFFFYTIRSTPAPDFQNVGDSFQQSGIPQAGAQLQQAYGSSTQFIEAQGSLQLEQVGTSTQTQ